ncbi:MAG: hypothetical protein P4L90_27600 [Rhodopila sp.]|nr:hypothetical protein [Rhodopila sp.]
MTQTDPNAPTTECIFSTIVGFMLPFFLAGAGGDEGVAKAAIRELIDAYNASTPTELDLAGRVIGFSIAAMDNLRLSMAPGLSDTKVLRYRCNAVTLSRASDQARKMLEALQAGREVKREIPRPSVAAAPPAPKPAPPVNVPAAPRLPNGGVSEFPMDIETMKRDARVMMAVFSKNGAQGSASPMIPDPAAAVGAAARAAVGSARRASAA